MIEKYGSNNGFGWNEGEIVGAQIVSVSMDKAMAHAERTIYVFISSLVLVFLFLVLCLNFILHMVVTKPMQAISEQADKISMGEIEMDELQFKGDDEIASLGRSFNRMQRSLGNAVKLLDETMGGDGSDDDDDDDTLFSPM